MRKFLVVLTVVLVVQLLVASVSYAAPPSSAPCYHRVRAGETLYSIGRLYHVSAATIASANHLWNPNLIYVGQWLWIPAGPPHPAPCPGPYHCVYTVRCGDTLYRIALRYGLNTWDLARHNGILNLNTIWAGQRLYVPCNP